MITSTLDFFTHGLYYPFGIILWIVILFRIVTRQFKPAEWLLLGLWVLLHLLEIVQLYIGDGGISRLPLRYFIIIAPLLWGWAAYGLVWFWNWRKDKWRWLARLIVIGFFAEVIGYEACVKLIKDFRKGSPRDAMVAAVQAAPYIKADYKGPARTDPFPYSPHEYFTGRRPAIVSNDDYTAFAWAVQGQGQSGDFDYPLTPDYYVDRVDGTYIEPDPDLYEFMMTVHGTRWDWRVYRRKMAP